MEAKEIDEPPLKRLRSCLTNIARCSVCFRNEICFMTQCRKGHLYCKTCFEDLNDECELEKKVMKCKICQIPMPGWTCTRALTAELVNTILRFLPHEDSLPKDAQIDGDHASHDRNDNDNNNNSGSRRCGKANLRIFAILENDFYKDEIHEIIEFVVTSDLKIFVVKIVGLFSKKDWYDVNAPSKFNDRNIGKTIVTRTIGTKIASEGLKGRVFEVSLADLQNDEVSFRKFKLCSEDVQGRNVLTNFHGMDMSTDKLKSMVKKFQAHYFGLRDLFLVLCMFGATKCSNSGDVEMMFVMRVIEDEPLFASLNKDLLSGHLLEEDVYLQMETATDNQIKTNFLQLLKETSDIDRQSKWSDIKKKIDSDSRYKAVDSSSRREDWFKDYVKTLEKEADEGDRKAREKQARVEASTKEREKEVQQSLANSLRERDKERDQHKKEETVQHFKALLFDKISTADLSWHDAKKILRKESRWEMAEQLERSEKQKLFDDHIDALNKKNREMFHKLLDETSDVALTSLWKEIKKKIKDDPRYTKFSSSDRKREKEFADYFQEKMTQAKADFCELLKETKLITYKSLKMIDESDQHFKDIENVLQNDKRYLVLECIKDERKNILMGYLEDLECKGPPPPPTATEPSRRSLK